eukprot:GFYU01004882.1.p1 GENE.GFYU01004882.1~~GFYU01004882.1.p1  ORF type:complete len:487 (-),score=51.11 GFYU01004882.1:285-1745(-)
MTGNKMTPKVIITLGGPLNADCTPSSNLQDRLQETVRQYSPGDIVIVTGAAVQRLGMTEAQAMGQWLSQHGITPILEERANNTVENAHWSKKIIDGLGLAKEVQIMMVTSDFHMPRSSLIFLHYFASANLLFRPVPSSQVAPAQQREPEFLVALLNNFPPAPIPDLHLVEEARRGCLSGVKEKLHQLNEVDRDGNTALHVAASRGLVPICEILLDTNKINVDCQNPRGVTPLHYALMFSRVDAVHTLLSRGARTDIRAPNHRWKGKRNALETLAALRPTMSVDLYTAMVLLLCKYSNGSPVVWLRHAESEHNASSDKTLDNGIFDARVTNNGAAVLARLNLWVRKFSLLDGFHVIVSPLTRTIQTYKGVTQGVNVRPIIDHRIRECMKHTCDIGKPRSQLQQHWGDVDFSRIPELWWHEPSVNNHTSSSSQFHVESPEQLASRVASFQKDLKAAQRSEHKVLVVAHGGVMRVVFNAGARNCDAFVE